MKLILLFSILGVAVHGLDITVETNSFLSKEQSADRALTVEGSNFALWKEKSGTVIERVLKNKGQMMKKPTTKPTKKPTRKPTKKPTRKPTRKPTKKPKTESPVAGPIFAPPGLAPVSPLFSPSVVEPPGFSPVFFPSVFAPFRV